MSAAEAKGPGPACPECGDDSHVYAKVDLRWSPTAKRWEIDASDDALECTECDAQFYPSDADFADVLDSIVETGALHNEEQALAAMCLWEAVCEDRHVGPAPWDADRENEGTCALRNRILGMAAQCDADWSHAQENMGFDAPFDWEFAPQWLRHNYGQSFATPAERLGFLQENKQ